MEWTLLDLKFSKVFALLKNVTIVRDGLRWSFHKILFLKNKKYLLCFSIYLNHWL
jgi:hypothetical protein